MVCEYLDFFSKARLRFTSMSMHVDMMGCPIDLIEISDYRQTQSLSLVETAAPLNVFKLFPSNLCGCDASRQLQLIDPGTAKVNPTLCSELTDSQLSLLGIGRSWSISGIQVNNFLDSYDEFMEICDILNKHNAYRSVKRLELQFGYDNKDIVDTLPTCDRPCVCELTA